MKRWISILVTVLVVFSLIGGAAFAQSDPLIDIAMDMARDLHTLANDEKYFELMGYTYTRDYISAFAAVDCDEMRSAYRVTSAATLIAQVMGGSRLSDVGRSNIIKSAYAGPGNTWNAQKSADAMSQAAVLSLSRSYLKPNGFQNCVILLDCGGAVYAVSCVETGAGIITATATPMFLDEGESMETVVQNLRQEVPAYAVEQIYNDEKGE